MQEFTVQLFDDGSAQIGGTGANLELRFGYSKNAHMYSVKFIRSKEWEDLYIRVHFHPEADIYDVDPVLAQNNIVNIPAMVTSMPGKGKLTIEGTDGYKTITSADIPYRVSENSGIDSETDPEPGESSFQQFVDAVKEDAKSAEQAAKDAESALAETKEAASLALSDIETARTNAISDIEKIESEVKGEIQEDVDSAKSSAKAASKSAEEAKSAADSAKKSLSDLETAKQGAVKAVEDKASEESSAIDEKAAQVIQSVQNAGDAEILAIGQATTSGIEQITQSAGQLLTQIDSAADDAVQDIMDVKKDSLDEFEAVNAHPPIQNPETGKWQVYSAETSSYVDTKYDWEGGYYSPSVDSEGNLTWQASKEGMDDIPSSNIRGPQGLGVPTPTTNDYGKTPTVNAAGTGYELTGPYAPLSAAITETAKGNPVSIADSVEWPLLGLKVYGKSTQDGTPSPENPVPIVNAGEGGSIVLTISDGADQSQSLTISTPNGLPGIPVDSGGNYTDVSGQQWKCNIIDGNQNVRNTETIIVDGNSTIENIDTTLADTTRFTVPLTHTGKVSTYLSICSHAKYKIIWIANETGFYIDNSNIIFRFPKNLIGETAESIKAWLSMQANNGTPLQVCYQLAKPIKTPLPEEELAAYRALHTYDGTTVVTPDDALAEVEVDYIVKPKAYIEKKLTAIETRLNALEISEALEGE